MKIAILSCFYPYRGGIAQFNASLLDELGRKHAVKAFNFKRQYPDFLFPGKTQYVTAQDEAVPVESETLLDTANPFTWPETVRRIREWGPDILIVRYWMSYFGPSLGYVTRRLAGHCKTIAILDNVIPHERHFFDTPLTRYFLSGIRGCVTMCGGVAEDLLKIKPDAVNMVHPHPVYSHFGEKLSREESETALGLKKGYRNLLFFGLIRKYKGLDILIHAFSRLDNSYQLIVAGEPYGSFDEYSRIIDESPAKDRIRVFPSYIRDSEVKLYFSAADAVVLPYRSATQSGVNAISLHFDVPMVVTDVGGLKETIGMKGTGIVAKSPTPEDVADAVNELFNGKGMMENCKRNMSKERDELSWSRYCDDLISFAGKL